MQSKSRFTSSMAKTFVGRVLDKLSILFASEAKRKSEKIDKEIAKEKEKYLFATYENLIMGVRRSGKSTLFQQLKRIYCDDGQFSEETRIRRREDIRKYVADSISDVLAATRLPLTSLKNLAVAAWLKENLKTFGFKCFERDGNLPKKFFNLPNFFNILWQDEMVKKYLETYGEYQMRDNVKYFFDRVDFIFEEDYLPTDEDILKCPFFSNKMEELHLDFSTEEEPDKYIFIDTGRENKQLFKCLPWKKKNKRIRKIPEAARYLIIFLVDCSCPEQLSASLTMLEDLVLSSYCFCLMIYVVLNKLDILKKYIFSGQSLENFFIDFPDFPDFVHSFSNDFRPRGRWEQEEDRRVVMAVKFIIQKIQIHRDVYYLYSTRKCVLQTTSGVLEEKDVNRIMRQCSWHNEGILNRHRFY